MSRKTEIADLKAQLARSNQREEAWKELLDSQLNKASTAEPPYAPAEVADNGWALRTDEVSPVRVVVLATVRLLRELLDEMPLRKGSDIAAYEAKVAEIQTLTDWLGETTQAEKDAAQEFHTRTVG